MKEHGASIGITHIGDEFFLRITIKGKLTHEDYQKLIPLIENAIVGVKEPKIKVLVDAREFEGWELRAAWDDLKFGLKHNKEFTKLAFVGDKEWEKYAIKISNWFMSGEMKYFDSMDKAVEWLNKEPVKLDNLDAIQKELLSRKEEIKKELRFLFNANMRITDWDVPEADKSKAKKILLDILQEGIDELKKGD